MTDTTVTYAVKDYKNVGKRKEKTIPGEEFIRRFLMHVPPKRFVRIRHYGLLSYRNKSKKMTHCRNLIGGTEIYFCIERSKRRSHNKTAV